jgi:hypothetical protein
LAVLGTLLLAATQALTAALHPGLVGKTLASSHRHATGLAHPAHHQLLKRGGDLDQFVTVQHVVAVCVELLQQLLDGRIGGIPVGRDLVWPVAVLPLWRALPTLLCRPFGDRRPGGQEYHTQAYADGGLTHGFSSVPISCPRSRSIR